uniref:Uncharacterized protein n=1 Tax=Geospiza parvula TaxID=87175 RepID=A0A8C3MHQ9_GEOPR
MSRRKIMRDVKIRAHLCPFLSRGIISCFVTRLINHSWRIESRLVIHGLSRKGSKRAGNVIEMRISGIPRKDGEKPFCRLIKLLGFPFLWSLEYLSIFGKVIQPYYFNVPDPFRKWTLPF